MLMISNETGVGSSLFGSEHIYKILSKIGYDCVDYSDICKQYSLFKGVYTLADDEFRAHWENELSYIKEAGLYCGQVHAPYNPPPDTLTDNQMEFFIMAVKRAIYACSIMESPYIVIHPVILPDWQKETNKTVEFNNKVFPQYIELAERYNVKIAVENMPGTDVPYSNAEKILELIYHMNSSRLVACHDTGHANISQVDVADMVRKLDDKLAVLHVHDNMGSADNHTCPYLGTINWDDFTAALGEIRYNGSFSLESGGFIRRFPKELYVEAESLQYKTAQYLVQKTGL